MIRKWIGKSFAFKDGRVGVVTEARMCLQRVNLTLDVGLDAPLYLTDHEIEMNVREAA